jgi:four helix bundle protein
MTAERTHRDLVAWQEAMNLVEAVYRTTEDFPAQEVYGLMAQMRRATISVPSNIAEGAARNSSREFFQYLGITMGFLAELETQFELALRLRYLSDGGETLRHVHRVGRLVNVLRSAFRSRTGTNR